MYMYMAEQEHQLSYPARSLVIVNARALTGDARQPWVDAVLVRDCRIVALGSSAELRKRAGKGTPVVDAGGRVVVSGLGDGTLVRGSAADLRIVESTGTESPVGAIEGTIIFAIADGRILVDRGFLAPP